MKQILFGCAAFSLLTATAFAADLGPVMPLKLPQAPVPFSWTGCYAGGQAGGGFGQTGLTDTAGVLSPFTGFTSANVNATGYTLGGQIGCDYQFTPNWVLGIEGAAAGGNIGGKTTLAVPAVAPGDVATFKDMTELLTSVTARAGYAWDRWLL